MLPPQQAIELDAPHPACRGGLYVRRRQMTGLGTGGRSDGEAQTTESSLKLLLELEDSSSALLCFLFGLPSYSSPGGNS